MAEPAPSTIIRPATPDRWQRALDRAFAQGVTVRQLECGVWTASSGTNPTGAYAVTLFDCECRAAAEGDACCKHRAALAYELGYLEPADAPAPIAPLYRCRTCFDTGRIDKPSTIRPGTTYGAPCPDCRAAIDIRPFLAAKYGRQRATVQ